MEKTNQYRYANDMLLVRCKDCRFYPAKDADGEFIWPADSLCPWRTFGTEQKIPPRGHFCSMGVKKEDIGS